jgi:hypothetical protein
VTSEEPVPAEAAADTSSEAPGPAEADEPDQNQKKKKKSPRRGRQRRLVKTVSWVLLVLACLLAVISVIAAYVRNVALDNDTYIETVAPLASNPAIQTAVANRVSERLVAETDLHQQVQQALPPKAGFLATPITDGVESATDQIVLKLVESPAFRKFWVVANRRAHNQVVGLLTGQQAGAFETSNGAVTLDLSNIEAQARKALDAKGITAFDKVTTNHPATLVLFQSAQLKRLQGTIRFFNRLVVLLPILALLLFAGAIALAKNRRRGVVRAGLGLAISMALILVVVAVVRNQYLSGLGPSRSKPANAAVIDTISAGLLDTVRTVLVLSALAALIAFLAGNATVRRFFATRTWPSWTTSGRAHDFVAAHRGALQWTTLGIALFILVVWNNPTLLVAVVVVLVALAVVGLVGLWGRRTSTTRSGGPEGPAPGAGPERGADTTSGAAPA